MVCNGGVLECPLDEPTYWYLDDDGDGFVQPPQGVSGQGDILRPYVHRKSCTAPLSGLDGKWIQSTYDWTSASERAADPLYQPLGDFDCCDKDANARPWTTYKSGTVNQCGSFDYNCDGVVTKVVPDGSTVTNPNQCANNCNHVEGWDTLYGCPQQCGQEGHWIHSWSLCTVTGWDKYVQRCQ